MIQIEFPDIRTKGRTLAALTAKVAGEVMHIGQFMDPQRRQDLWRKGLGQLKPLMRPIEKNTDIIAQEILDWLRCASDLNGLTLAISTDMQIAGLVLPKSAKLFYVPYYNKAVSAEHVNSDIQIPSTTSHYFRENGIDLPSEGYSSSEGVNAPFQVRWTTSWVQHGGFLVDNNQGKVSILDYKRFIAERDKNLHSGEYAIEANWYMDSEHQEEVCARKNLQETRPYNCLGIFERPDGHKRYFVVTATWDNHLYISERLGYEGNLEQRNLTIRHIAAMANLLANMYSAKRWAVGGLEFNSGDVCFNKERQLRSYFAGYF